MSAQQRKRQAEFPGRELNASTKATATHRVGKRECTSCIMCALIMGAFIMRAPPNEEVSLLRAAVDLSSVLLTKKKMKVCSESSGGAAAAGGA